MSDSRSVLGVSLVVGLLVPAEPVTQGQEAVAHMAGKAVEQGAATCRREPVRQDACAAALGAPDVSEAAIAAHEQSTLTDQLLRPGCTQLPLSLTRDQVREVGRRIVVMTGGCGAGSAWTVSRRRMTG